LILTAKFHSLYVKESESENLERSGVGVGNFGKSESGVEVRYFTYDSATLIETLTEDLNSHVPARCQPKVIFFEIGLAATLRARMLMRKLLTSVNR